MTIDEALDRFLVQLAADGRSEHTIGQYRRHMCTLGALGARRSPTARPGGGTSTTRPSRASSRPRAQRYVPDAAVRNWPPR